MLTLFSQRTFRQFAWLAALVLVGCIVPPKPTPQVLSSQELELLVTVKRAKDLALSGRPDQAEREFLKAIAKAPTRSSLYNDLGFVLDSQERSIEAMRSYLKALQLDPANLSARTNLARALYKAGRWERALEQYQRAVEQYQRLGYGERVDGAVSFTRTDLVSAYQNMAFIAAALGLTDQAVCYAQEARAVGDPLFGELEYARFLISVAKLGSAEEVLQRAILSQGADVAPAYLVDYAVVLTLLGKANLAHENIERVILSDLAESEIQDCAYRLALAIDPQILQPKERDEVCLQSEPLSWSYWPLHLRERIKKRVGEVCERAGVS